MSRLSLKTVVSRGSEHVETRVGDQTMMMSIAQGSYFSVDATAARIWDLIEAPVALSDVVSKLMSEYEVSEQQCSEQVLDFVEQLIANGLAVEQ